MKIDEEIEEAKNLKISNEEELFHVNEKYFSKNGLLPRIYALSNTGTKEFGLSILKKLVELRKILNEKIKIYKERN